MKEFSIEDTIIAYFDGQLTDSESAELLHRVSVSPEIREAFQAHEMLREVSIRAARNVSVPSRLDDAVFANLAALQAAERPAVPIAFWSAKRITAAASIALLLLAIGFGTAKLMDSQSTSITSAIQVGATNPVSSGTPTTVEETASELPRAAAEGNAFTLRSATVSSRRSPITTAVRSESSRVAEELLEAASGATSATPPLEQAIAIVPVSSSSEVPSIQLPEASGLPGKSLRDLTVADATADVEIGLETASQFSIPSAQLSFTPFQDFRFHAGYNLDEGNQVGVRVRSGSFEHLEAAATLGGFATELNGVLRPAKMMSGEAYYEHREPVANGRAWIIAGVGAGFYTDGSLLSADFGVKIPVSDHLLAGFTVALSRLHQNGATTDFLAAQSGPVIYTGDERRNTINGRLEYGLSYRF